ncbi:MAG: hypothetical protein IKG39_12110 [Lachnospiraceae bacterium]|nr:hypothetical protein [Lachnospiraceae bacterium]
MKNRNQESVLFLGISLWVWIVTAASALILAALTVFFFVPASKRVITVKPRPSLNRQAQDVEVWSSKEEPTTSAVNQAQQRITISPESGGYVLILENKKSASWEKVFSCPAKVSENGVSTVYGEGKRTTPEGTFRILFTIGASEPATGLDYFVLDEKSVWVDDQNSKYYNSLQTEDLADQDWKSAEHIYSFFNEGNVNYAIFYDYNGDGKTAYSATKGKGAALFVFGRYDYDTAVSKYGDILISASDMKSLLTYLFSFNEPIITINAQDGSNNGVAATESPASETETMIVNNDTSTQEEVVLAWVCEYTQMTAEQFYEAGGHIDYETSGTLYDYYNVAVPMAAATIVEITKTPPYTIDRTGSSYAFTGPGGWGYR